MEDRLAPNPVKLLEQWNEWERGETPPGRVMANLKTGGLPLVLQALVDEITAAAAAETPDSTDT